MRLQVLHEATWGGGGAGDFFFAPRRCGRTRQQSSAARETESREVLTRHVETEWHAAG